MKKLIVTLVLSSILVVGFTGSVFSHSGGTNFAGCHYVWVNGVRVGYHCHHSNRLDSKPSVRFAQSPYTRYPSYTQPRYTQPAQPRYNPSDPYGTKPYTRGFRIPVEQQRQHRAAEREQLRGILSNCAKYNKGCALQLRGLGR